MPLTICIFASNVSQNEAVKNVLQTYSEQVAFLNFNTALINTDSLADDILKEINKTYKETVFIFRNTASNWATNGSDKEINKWIQDVFNGDVLPRQARP